MRFPRRTYRARPATRVATVVTFAASCIVPVGALLAGARWGGSGLLRAGHSPDTVAAPAFDVGVVRRAEPPHGPRVDGEVESAEGPVTAVEPPAVPFDEDVGPVPARYADLEVVRAGRDRDGWPTWWHADGTITKRARQRVVGQDGVVRWMPVVLHFARASRRR